MPKHIGRLWKRYWEERNNVVYDYETETELLATELRRHRATSFLSLGCGMAPYIRRLVPRGFAATGVDIDKGLLRCGQSLLEERGINAELICADIRTLSIEGTFDAAIAMHLTFPEQDWAKILEGLRRVLPSGASFIVGLVYRNKEPLEASTGVVANLHFFDSGTELAELDVYRAERSYYQCSLTLIHHVEGRAICGTRNTRIHYFTDTREATKMLKLHGFDEISVLDQGSIGFPGLDYTLVKARAM